MMRKGRVARGEKGSGAKLSEFQAMDIRRRFRAGERQAALAVEYGISLFTVKALCRGKTWRHLPDARATRSPVVVVRR